MLKFKLLFTALLISYYTYSQNEICLDPVIGHIINSKELHEERTYWVSLPLNYSDSIKYPVIYVFDAEWRFNLVRQMAFDLGGHNKIQKSIIVGIPHVEWENQRGIDLTFSQSRIEYDGDAVDSTWYNTSNSGGGSKFYKYLTNELIPDVNRNYSTNDHETLIGHSYGGYFGAYILSFDHPFEVIHMYDPSIWYSNGEVISQLKNTKISEPVKIHLTYQQAPLFHRTKIEEFIGELDKNDMIELSKQFYENETHNSLYLDSFYEGIQITNKTQ